MASNQILRQLSSSSSSSSASILKLSTLPKLGLSSFAISESTNLSVSNSSATRRFICSSTKQHQKQQDQEEENNGSRKLEGEETQIRKDEDDDEGIDLNEETGEIGGPRGPEPTRYGDWERNGRCYDF